MMRVKHLVNDLQVWLERCVCGGANMFLILMKYPAKVTWYDLI